MFNMIKRLFHDYQDNYNAKQNKVIATRKLAKGQYEIVFWSDWYEVYFRPYRKRYGYYLNSFSSSKEAFKFLNKLPDTPPLSKLLGFE